MKNKITVEEIKERTLIFDNICGKMVNTVDINGEVINYVFRTDFFNTFIYYLRKYIFECGTTTFKDLEETFGKMIFNEYRQKCAVKRVVIIGINYLLIKNDVYLVKSNTIQSNNTKKRVE